MAIDRETFVFGVRDCKIAKLTDDSGSEPTYDTAVDVPGIQELEVSFNIDTKELKGDDTTLDKRTTISSISLDVTHAKISLDALPVLLGGATTESGTSPDTVITYRQGEGQPPYFKLAAQVVYVDEEGADLHFLAYKCKVSDFTMGATGDDYRVVSFSAEAIPCTSDPSLFYDLIEHETATSL